MVVDFDPPVGANGRHIPLGLIRAVAQIVNDRFHCPGALESFNFAHKASLRAGGWRDWIIAANMEHQPLRHNLTRNDFYPGFINVTHHAGVNRSVIQRLSERLAPKVVKRESTSCWGN